MPGTSFHRVVLIRSVLIFLFIILLCVNAMAFGTIAITTTMLEASCGRSDGKLVVIATGGTLPYTFSIDGINFQLAGQFMGLAAGTYTITVKDALDVTATTTAIVKNNDGPQMVVQTTPASCVNTNGTITIQTTGGVGTLMFSIDNGSHLQTDGNFTGLDSGLYMAYVKDAAGCFIVAPVQLTALPTPKVYIGDDTVMCSGQVLKLSVPHEPDYTYIWDDNSTGLTFPVTQTGVYSVKVTNQYGCYASTSINVLFKTSTLFTLGNDTTLCKGNTVELHPNPALDGTYQWSNGTTGPTLPVSSPGLYWLTLMNDGCEKSDSIQVAFEGPADNLGSDTGICENQSLLLNAGNSGAQYQWQDGSSQMTFLVSTPGTYSVKVKEDGCESLSQINVSALNKPEINIGTTTSLCFTEKLTLDASSPFSSYLWQDGSTSPQFSVSEAGMYSVNVTNSCGSTKDSIQIQYENCDCKFHVPNAFTPNSDGRNDLFLPKSNCLSGEYDLKIYNRWGQLVFESKNSSQGWDGTFGHQPEPEGGYIWMLQYRNRLTGKLSSEHGSVVLIR